MSQQSKRRVEKEQAGKQLAAELITRKLAEGWTYYSSYLDVRAIAIEALHAARKLQAERPQPAASLATAAAPPTPLATGGEVCRLPASVMSLIAEALVAGNTDNSGDRCGKPQSNPGPLTDCLQRPGGVRARLQGVEQLHRLAKPFPAPLAKPRASAPARQHTAGRAAGQSMHDVIVTAERSRSHESLSQTWKQYYRALAYVERVNRHAWVTYVDKAEDGAVDPV